MLMVCSIIVLDHGGDFSRTGGLQDAINYVKVSVITKMLNEATPPIRTAPSPPNKDAIALLPWITFACPSDIRGLITEVLAVSSLQMS